MINPTTLGAQHSNKWDDGTAFKAADFAALEVSVDGKAPVALTVPYAPDGKYQFPATALGVLGNGPHTFALRVTATNGRTSGLSLPLAFQIDVRTPDVPFGLSAS